MKHGTIGIQVIRGKDFDKMLKEANKHPGTARDFMMAFMHWDKAIERENFTPHCFSCGTVVRKPEDDEPGNFGGFAFGRFNESEAPTVVDGYGCPFCCDCEPKGWDKLRVEFSDVMRRELGLGELHAVN